MCWYVLLFSFLCSGLNYSKPCGFQLTSNSCTWEIFLFLGKADQVQNSVMLIQLKSVCNPVIGYKIITIDLIKHWWKFFSNLVLETSLTGQRGTYMEKAEWSVWRWGWKWEQWQRFCRGEIKWVKPHGQCREPQKGAIKLMKTLYI